MKPRETSTDYRHPYRPRPVAAANALVRTLGRAGWRGADLSEGSLIAAARRRTGLHHLGDEDFFLPLRRLLDALEHEANLHPIGRFAARENLIRMLSVRLRFFADLDRDPRIDAIELEPPVVIAGLQRTGTTVIHRLLAQDPSLRCLASWEAINPAMPPRAQRGNGSDPRIKQAQFAEGSLRYLAPDFFAIHPVEAESPEEDCLLLDYCFMSTVPEATQQVTSFSRWLERQDHEPAYRFLARMLKYLMFQRPADRWVLKSPHHLEHFDELLTVFPGAQIIHTHRDPVTSLASFCSMMSHAYGIFSDQVDPVDVGAWWLRKTEVMVRRALEAREARGPEPFFDAGYQELVEDPLGLIRRIYDFLGRELTHDVEQKMQRWLEANPQHKHGRHCYGLEHFGLEHDRVAEAFADYRRRFDLGPTAGGPR